MHSIYQISVLSLFSVDCVNDSNQIESEIIVMCFFMNGFVIDHKKKIQNDKLIIHQFRMCV